MSRLKKLMKEGLAAQKLIERCPMITGLTLPLQASLGRELQKFYDEAKAEGYKEAAAEYEKKYSK